MDLKQAQYLEAVCKTGSISAAAVELYVSRTVISHSLRDLEEEFNATLFTRTRTGIVLTEAGEVLREHCRQLKASYKITKDKIDALSFETPQSTLKFAITTTAGIRFFPEFFLNFQQMCPDVTYTIDEMSAYSTIESVREGGVDFAITPVSLQGGEFGDIGMIFLHKIESVVCVSREDPLSKEKFLVKEQIADRAFVTPVSRSPLSFPLKITMRINQINLIHKIVTSGMAITVLPAEYVKDWNDVACIPFKEPVINDVNIIWNKDIPHSSAFHRFLNYVKQYDISKLADY